jgi:ORF6N domain
MKPEDLPFKTPHELSDRVVVVRGLKVILDSDLAALYGVATKRLNEKVRRHSDRFPPDFMFLLTSEEWESLRSQIATLRPGRPPRRRFLPYVFTEGGALMASGLLKSPRAIEMSIGLARASVIWP